MRGKKCLSPGVPRGGKVSVPRGGPPGRALLRQPGPYCDKAGRFLGSRVFRRQEALDEACFPNPTTASAQLDLVCGSRMQIYNARNARNSLLGRALSVCVPCSFVDLVLSADALLGAPAFFPGFHLKSVFRMMI